MKKQVVATVLTLSVVLAGCGSSSTATSSSASTSTSSTTTTSSTQTEDTTATSSAQTEDTTTVSTSAQSTDTATASSTATSASATESDGITADEFAAIENGMSYDEVKAIIGEDGTEDSTSEISGVTTVVYSWSSEGFGTANVTFQNDQVVNKAQIGVDSSSVTVTMDQYNQVETGMSYDEVKTIMGGDGSVMSDTTLADQHSVIYSWSGSALGSSCTVTFINDAVSSKSQAGLE